MNFISIILVCVKRHKNTFETFFFFLVLMVSKQGSEKLEDIHTNIYKNMVLTSDVSHVHCVINVIRYPNQETAQVDSRLVMYINFS